MKRVFVLDGRSRASITIIRSLGKRGLSIDVGDEFRSFSTYSKYCTKSIIYPSAKNTPDLFNSFITEKINNNEYDAIIPVRDHTTQCLVKINKDGLYDNIFCLPKEKDYKVAKSKSNTIKLAESLNVPFPKSIVTTDYENDVDILIKEVKNKLSYPVLLKPSYSSGSRGIIIVNSSKDLALKLNKFIAESFEGLIQEFVPYGGSYGVEMLYQKGVLKAKFVHKRLREYPVNGGPSTYRCAYQYPEIEKYAKKILDYLNWNGVGMVEFRLDARTGTPMLMEINPRFWGSLAMAYYSGVDFPILLYNLITKNKCDNVFNYNLNKKTRWLFWGDILWLISWKKNNIHEKNFFKFFHRDLHYDIINKDDIKPLFGLFIDSFRSLFSLKKLKHIFSRGW